MGYVIKNNLSARNALVQLNQNNEELTKAMRQAATGEKVTSAADDASSYAISESMRVQIRGLNQDVQNVQTGTNLIRVAEGGIHALASKSVEQQCPESVAGIGKNERA